MTTAAARPRGWSTGSSGRAWTSSRPRWFAAGRPPLNVRFLIEGEEEVSGRSLPDYVRANADRLRTDYLLIADGNFAAPGLPELVTGLRGLLYTEIEVTGPRVDLHSGMFG